MSQEYVFRFLTVRPGSQRKKIERAPKTVPVYDTGAPTPLGAALKQLHDAGASAAEVLRLVRGYQESAAHLKSLDGLPFDVTKALQWLAEQSAKKVKNVKFDVGLQKLYGHTAAELVATDDFKRTRERLSDTLVAEAFRSTWERPTDGLASARKWIWLVEQLAGGHSLEPETPFGVAFADLLLWIADFARLPAPPKQDRPPAPPPTPDPAEEEREKHRVRLTELEDTHRELSRKTTEDEALIKPEVRVAEEGARFAAFEQRLAKIESKCAEPPEGGVPRPDVSPKLPPNGGTLAGSGGARVLLTPATIAGLSDVAKRVLVDSKLDLAKVEPTFAVGVLEEEMRVTAARIASAEAPDTVLMLGGVMLD